MLAELIADRIRGEAPLPPEDRWVDKFDCFQSRKSFRSGC